MNIFGYGQDATGMSTRKYRILYIATPIKDISDIPAGAKLVVQELEVAATIWDKDYKMFGELEIKSNIRGLHKEE